MHPLVSAYQAHQKTLPGDSPRQGLRIWRQFTSEVERGELLKWALAMRPHLGANGRSRQYRQTDDLPNRPAAYEVVRRRLEGVLNLDNPEREPIFGWYLSIIDKGGAVHNHIDPTKPGQRHLRCNIFLQLPQAGGFPIVGGYKHPVGPGDLLAFFPSEKRHSSEVVSGSNPRVILSFGYLTQMHYRLSTKQNGVFGSASRR